MPIPILRDHRTNDSMLGHVNDQGNCLRFTFWPEDAPADAEFQASMGGAGYIVRAYEERDGVRYLVQVDVHEISFSPKRRSSIVPVAAVDDDPVCTCLPSCDPACKGTCGCVKCNQDYNDFLSVDYD